jgi:hypothetical protein
LVFSWQFGELHESNQRADKTANFGLHLQASLLRWFIICIPMSGPPGELLLNFSQERCRLAETFDYQQCMQL